MMDINAYNLEQAVSLFYRSEAAQQANAHQWLTQAQRSPEAWAFVWDLLQPSKVHIFEQNLISETFLIALVYLKCITFSTEHRSTILCCNNFTYEIT